MTREEIEAAMPGRSLDRLVAPLAGWVYQRGGHWISPENGMGHFNPPLFSANISEAWTLFAGKGWIIYENKFNDMNGWFIFADERALVEWIPLGCAPTVELAICRAALAAHYLATKTTASPAPSSAIEKDAVAE